MTYHLTRPLTRQRRLLRLLILILGIWSCALMSAPAAAQGVPSESEIVRVPVRVLRQCEQDAARVDGLESRLRACQRDLDTGSGALDEARRQAAASAAALEAARRRAEELERERAARWPPWAWMGIGAGGALVGVVLVAILTR